MSIIFKKQSSGATTLPDPGKVNVFVDSLDGLPKFLDEFRNLNFFSVNSFNGRGGSIIPLSGDYSSFYQLSSPVLNGLSGLTIVQDSITVGTGTNVFSQITFSANTFLAKSSTGSLSIKSISDFGLNLITNVDIFSTRTTLGLGSAALKNTGNTINDPGTGNLEISMPTTGITATSKTYLTTDRGKAFERYNNGSAMTDTLPSLGMSDNGFYIIISNVDTVITATLTVISPSGLFNNGTNNFIINYGRRQAITWNGTNWVFVLSGNNNLLKKPSTVSPGDFPQFIDSTGQLTGQSVSLVRIDLSIDNVNNTSDANKPVSIIQAIALNTKSNISGQTFTGGIISPSFSANTISGGTLYSGSTELGSIFNTNIANLSTIVSAKVSSITNSDSTIIISGNSINPTVSRASLTGDVTAATGSNSLRVVAINGQAVSPSAATNGQVLQYVSASSQYIPFSYAGDVGGGPSASVVNAIKGQPVTLTSPATNDLLQYKSGQFVNTNLTALTSQLSAATITSNGLMSFSDKNKLTKLDYDIVNDYGADPTGTNDSAPAIQNAVNAAQIAAYAGNSGGVIWFPAGRYKIGSTINVSGSGISFIGVSAGHNEDFGNFAATMSSHIFTSGAFPAVVVCPSFKQGLVGTPVANFRWNGVGIDCYSNSGTRGLQLISCHGFEIENYFCINATETALDFNCLPAAKTTVGIVTFPLTTPTTINVSSTAANGTGPAFPASGSVIIANNSGTSILVTYTATTSTTLLGCTSTGAGTAAIGTFVTILPGAQDCTRGHIGRVSIRVIDGGGSSGVGIRTDGDGAGFANTCINSFNNSVIISHNNGIAIKDINSDTNDYDNVTINRAPGGTGIGVEIGAASTAAGASRNNVFKHLSAGLGGLTARGTQTNTFASGPTYIWDYQLANGEAKPTIENGAALYYTYNGAFPVGGIVGTPSIADQAIGSSITTLITGSLLPIPPQGLLAGTTLRLNVIIDKTAAGVSASTFNLRLGTLGTTADTSLAQFVTGAGTATIDTGKFVFDLTIRTSVGAGSTALATMSLTKNAGTIVGWDVLPTRVIVGTMSTFTSNTAAQFLSASITPGAAVVPNIRQCYWECIKPGI